MSKHTNKYWIKEKEFILLNLEYEILYDFLSLQRNVKYRWHIPPNTRVSEINRKFILKFYNQYYRNSIPKWYRQKMNKRERAKSKEILFQILNGKEICFVDNYKNGSNYW